MKIYWNDIKSEAMNSEEYLNQIQEKEDLMHNYNNYAPNENILTNIRETYQIKAKQLKSLL